MPHNKKRDYSIGVFDSGIGGLTVVKELMRQLPLERIVYFGDTARVPYGTKSKESVIRFSKENTALLLRHKVKIIVVACNTSSSVAIPALKKKFRVPIIGVITPGARKAAQVTKNKKVGVIATAATINSRAYVKSVKKINFSIRVVNQACPLFVPLVEEGWNHRKVTATIAKEYLAKITRSRADTVILGCTHYPLLKEVIKKTVGENVALVDSAKEVALEVKKVLEKNNMQRIRRRLSQHTFLVSDDPRHFCRLAKRFLGFNIKNVKRKR